MNLLHHLQSLTPSEFWSWLLSLTPQERIIQTAMWLCLAAFYALYLYWKYYLRVPKSRRTIEANEFQAAYRKAARND